MVPLTVLLINNAGNTDHARDRLRQPCGARIYDSVFDLQISMHNSIMRRDGTRK